MSKGEVLYVKGMNFNNQTESEGEEENEDDVWDDTKLNAAYDKAVTIANMEIAKRIAMSTNNRGPKTVPVEGVKDKKSQPVPKPGAFKSSSKDSKVVWKAGMPCRAIYEPDGREYEAFVLKIVNDKECVVRFLGYENSELVSLKTLTPSLGNKERARQIQEALNGNSESHDDDSVHQTASGMECDSDRHNGSVTTEKSAHRKKKSSKKKRTYQRMEHDMPLDYQFHLPTPGNMMNMNLGSTEIPFPPPPMAFPTSTGSSYEEQALNSMLLSWYMSGYHAGMYQGIKRGKELARSKK